jgi:hypothetical protein
MVDGLGMKRLEMMRWKVSEMVIVSEMSKMKIRVIVGTRIMEWEVSKMTMSEMVLVGSEMMNMFEVGTKVMQEQDDNVRDGVCEEGDD